MKALGASSAEVPNTLLLPQTLTAMRYKAKIQAQHIILKCEVEQTSTAGLNGKRPYPHETTNFERTKVLLTAQVNGSSLKEDIHISHINILAEASHKICQIVEGK